MGTGIKFCNRLQAKLEPYSITWVTVRAQSQQAQLR